MYKNCHLLIKSYDGCEGCDAQATLREGCDVKITGVSAFDLLTSRGEMYTEAEGNAYVITYNDGRLRIRSLKSGRIVFTRKTEALRLMLNN